MKLLNYIILLCSLIMLGACSDDDDKIESASLVVDNTELSFSGYQSTIAVKVDANRRWSAVPSDWWISITPDGYPSAGQHFVVNVALTVSDNDTNAVRDGYVKFYIGDDEYATLNIHQDIQNEEDRPEEEYPITWANLQWAASTAIAEGTYFEAGCCVYANGITNAMESTTGEDIVAQIGYSAQDSRPDGEDWTWYDCWFNGDWGDNFYYQGKIEEVLPAGFYYYTFRARNGSGEWKYAGTDGLWDGINNLSGTFEVLPGSGEQNYDGLEITWANLQWWASDNINVGEYFEAGALVYIDGLTNADTPSVDGNGVIGQIGYSLSDDPTQVDWIWYDGWFNGDWGDNYYYQATTPEILQAGTYYWSFRFKMGEDGEWAYAGTEGLWDGQSNVCGTFTVNGASSDLQITWANLQWWASDAINAGDAFEAGATVFVDGLTNLDEASVDGGGMIAQMGYSTSSNPTAGEWSWTDAFFNGDWGDNWYFQCRTDAIDTAGSYYWTFRFKLGAAGEWKYAGTNGLWDGDNCVLLTFTVN